MAEVPIFERLQVHDYGMYPGADGAGIDVQFLPGTTLILGANGLGKTTLISILYRLLTGPFDIPALAGRGPLGSSRTSPTQLNAARKRAFADRVRDGAVDASAELTLTLGNDTLSVRRELRNLKLERFVINDIEQSLQEAGFQREVMTRAGLLNFGDWILMLRHLVFYFEDRRALVWDPTAQRHVLRFLMLDLPVSRRWAADERAILELDSRVRNMSATLFQWERAMSASEETIAAAPDVREQLRALERTQTADLDRREFLDSQLMELDESRQTLRVRHLTAEQSKESAYQNLDRLRLAAIAAKFPERSSTARYLLAQLMTGQECLVCGSYAETAAAEYADRIHRSNCVVCGTPLEEPVGTPVGRQEMDAAETAFANAEETLTAAIESLETAQSAYDDVFAAVHQLSATVTSRSKNIDSLIDRLPPEETELREKRDNLSKLRRELEDLRKQLRAKRDAFKSLIREINRSLAEWSERVTTEFMGFAQGFLIEEAELLWSPHKARVGETGEMIEFPSFQLNLSGADFDSPVRRSGPDQVSESQREFIDLAFRMALMTVATDTGRGSLVIDAPESSLDAVFVGRAADVLGAYGSPQGRNRVILASNLVEGGLIPSLIELAVPQAELEVRVLDLLENATPTAAVREHSAEYAAFRDEMLGQA